MKELMRDNEMKKHAKTLSRFVGQIADEVNRMSTEKKQRQLQAGIIDERRILSEAEPFLRRELSAEVYVYSEDDPHRHDPKNRSQLAKPRRPAIYIE